MKLVLLSGGSGKRLWPLSNDSRSKQFLKVLTNSSLEKESMVERVWGQLKSVGMANSAVIATSKSQVDMLENQLGSVPIVIEPYRRDTFPAIALSASYLYSEGGCDLDETIGVLPVDPYVEDSFFAKIKELDNTLQQSNADLALIGVRPTYPSEKYGYMVPSMVSETDSYLSIDCFVEKPKEEQATELIQKGALWNSGVFAFKLKYIMNLLKEMDFPTNYKELFNYYEKLPKISFDYEVVEKAENIVSVTYDGYWKDLGTWNTLTEEMNQEITGRGIIGGESSNTHILNELDIPVSVLGLSNIVVAASPDGILVSDKQSSPLVKELVNDLEQQPMYVEKSWGAYKIFDHYKTKEGKEALIKKVYINKNEMLSYEYHLKRSETWTILSGNAEVLLDGKIKNISAGDIVEIGIGVKHSIRAYTDIEIIEVQTGIELIESDTFYSEEVSRIYK